MFDFLKTKPAFGLDIGDLSLKIVQFKKIGKNFILSSYLKEEIPAGLIHRGEVQDEEKLVRVIQESLPKVKGEPLLSNQVVCNLPEEKVFLRIIQLPQMKKEEINEAVKWEAEAHIPLSLSEAYLGWQIIKPIFNHLDHVDILVAAAPRRLVESYLSFLKKSGLQPAALEPESAAVVRSLLRPDDLKPTVIVDLGATGANFVIFSASTIRFTSRIPAISGQAFNQAISQRLNISEAKANQLKIKAGLDKTKEKGEVYQALLPIIDNLAKQISEYVDFYHNHATHIHGPDGAVGKVVLCGGDSLLINLAPFLKEQLKLPVETANPFINIPRCSGIELAERESLSSGIVIGLALRDFYWPNG